MSNKKIIQKGWLEKGVIAGSSAVLAAILAACSGASLPGGKTEIDLNNYYDFWVDGMSGSGYASWDFNEEAFQQDFEGKIKVSLTEEDKEIAKEEGFSEKAYLEQKQENALNTIMEECVQPMIELDTSTCDPTIDSLYDGEWIPVEEYNGSLENDEVIRLTYEIKDRLAEERYNCTFKTDEQEMTVQLDMEIWDPEDLTDEELQPMKDIAENALRDIYEDTVTKKSVKLTYTDPELAGLYCGANNNEVNKFYMLYRIPVTVVGNIDNGYISNGRLEHTAKVETAVYSYVCFKNVYRNIDSGKVKFNKDFEKTDMERNKVPVFFDSGPQNQDRRYSLASLGGFESIETFEEDIWSQLDNLGSKKIYEQPEPDTADESAETE